MLEAVAEIGASNLFPIHTEYPEAYKGTVPKITFVKEGERYDL
ncbi:MAG TPA: hypothetical protein VFG24_02150 [Nitrosopumilaceae archaeon]|nr:hypothetical protein [Nitrosopumilaceae archaeon]